MNNENQLLANFTANRDRERQNIANQSQDAVKKLMPAYDTILNACLPLVDRASGHPVARGHPQSASMFLSAQFLQGLDITRKTIILGAYHQAANLLKQETETLDALHEIRTGSRKDRKTTKFRGEMKRFGRKYGDLNEIAHPTSEAIVELLASRIDGNNVAPTIEKIFK
jgi:hypothetical protein